MKRVPKIAFTMGDPCGVGPEIIVRAIAHNCRSASEAEIFVYGSPDILETARERFAPDSKFTVIPCGSMPFEAVKPGMVDPAAGMEAYHAVERATLDALSGKIDAIVTAPMNKTSVNEAGIAFTGHTEFIAELCNCSDFAMMQSAGKLHVVFVSTHIPVCEASAAVTFERIVKVTELLHEVLLEEGLEKPKIAMAALNPHAGENGHMGTEEERVIKPAIAELRKKGMDVSPPFPPDTLFIKETLDRFDGVVSMYHDQGHIPFKMLAFDRGVNSTLGIPVIRTSVDHGTAFDIAWKGTADIGSISAAYHSALTRALNRINRK